MTEHDFSTLLAAGFRKSSYSGENAQCVEVAHGSAVFAVRDSKNLTGPVLAITSDHGREFLTAVKAGQLDR